MKNALTFLKKIKKNNNTEWMRAHKDEYLAAKAEFEFLVQEVLARIAVWDPKLEFVEPKQCIFRFNRDIRFSDDKRPYKEHFGAFMAQGGRNSGLPGYYLHIAPNEVFVAGGVWMPPPDKLTRLRRHIIQNSDDLLKVLKDKKFKANFTGLNTDHMLKRLPKGFEAEGEIAELLKFKSFTVSKDLPVAEVLRSGFGKQVDKSFQMIKPLNDFLVEGL